MSGGLVAVIALGTGSGSCGGGQRAASSIGTQSLPARRPPSRCERRRPGLSGETAAVVVALVSERVAFGWPGGQCSERT